MGTYIPSTPEERSEMLATLGLKTEDDLYAVVPEKVRIKGLNIPSGLTEFQVTHVMDGIAAKNTRFPSIFRGAGAYRHYIPAIVKTVTSKEEFLTAYTPYQAEISQGILQSIFEYQTQMCELTGMDASNASVYDGAVAAAEAVMMCQDRKHSGVLISEAVDPQTLTVVRTYCASRNVPVTVVPMNDYATDVDALKAALTPAIACVCVQTPNYYGVIEDMGQIVEAAHGAGTKAIAVVNPISLGLLKTPGEYGADIAVGEGQPLGMPIGFGGPYLGFMTCKQELLRKLPGRIVGETVDSAGKRCYVLTLQAREQHIRREKASSNICSNEALCAMTASVYLAAVGPKGLRQAAISSSSHAHYLADRLAQIPGFGLVTKKPFFHEFLTSCPVEPEMLCKKLEPHGILAGLPVSDKVLWCCTECNSKEDIDQLITAIQEVCA